MTNNDSREEPKTRYEFAKTADEVGFYYESTLKEAAIYEVQGETAENYKASERLYGRHHRSFHIACALAHVLGRGNKIHDDYLPFYQAARKAYGGDE